MHWRLHACTACHGLHSARWWAAGAPAAHSRPMRARWWMRRRMCALGARHCTKLRLPAHALPHAPVRYGPRQQQQRRRRPYIMHPILNTRIVPVLERRVYSFV